MENQMIQYIEIRQAEGGEDSQLFVDDLARAYIRMASKLG
jgi:protein subunit release factor A